jgi:hypothetical protein
VTPFQQFRLWSRGGPRAERAATAIAFSVLLVLVAWASVPGSTPEGSSAALDAAVSGSPEAPGAGPAGGGAPVGGAGSGAATRAPGSGTTAPVLGSLPAGRPGAANDDSSSRVAAGTAPGAARAAAPGTAGCGTAGATDVGVTSQAIRVGVSLPDLGGLGPAFNVPAVEDQQKAWDAVFAVYNQAGGVQCRKLTPRYYRDDVTSATAEHATCLQMVQDKLFAVIQNFYFPEESTCLARNKIPNFWYIPPHTNQVRSYYPYILSYQPDYDRLVRDYVQGAQQLGWFKGRGKVGILEGTCFPDLNKSIDRELTAVGIASSQRSVFNYGCDPGAPSQPEKDTQGVLQFKREGVTHVLSVAYGRSFSFSSVADGQDYRPKYAVMDDGQVAGSNHSTANPTGAGFDGALAIAVSQLGEQDSPNVKPSAATAECIRIMKAAGMPSPLSAGGASYGSPCAGVKMFVAAAANAAGLTRTSLAAGLARVGSLDLSFPAGPANFRDPRNPTGGGFWRPLRFDRSATCWRVESATFRKGSS